MSLSQAVRPGAGAPAASVAGVIDAWLGRCIEFVAAVLIVFEVALLFSGVVARYALHHPIVWSDELAGSVFLWLGMLGAVIALRRGEHLAFNALSQRVSPRAQVLFQAVVLAVVFATLCLLLKPAYDYVEDETFAVLPNLGVPSSWRVLGIAVGVVLMLATVLLQAVSRGNFRATASGAAIVLVLGLVLWQLAGPLARIGNLNLFVFFVLIVGAAIVIGVPIGFAFGLATLTYLACTTSTPLSVVVNRLDQGMSQPLLLAIPMFIFLGLLIEVTGFARTIIALLASLMGFVRGGLYYVLLVAMLLVSGISGSKVADMAAVAPGLFPEMRRRGAKDGDLTALLASSAAMADTIPPSIVLITLGSVTGMSIASLFSAGILPALVLTVALGVVTFVRTRDDTPPEDARPDWSKIRKALLPALPAIALPFVIRWAVVEGVATATEVSTIGIVYALVVGILLYRPVQWKRFYPALVETAVLSGAILFVIGTATGMAWSLTQSGFSSQLAKAMTALSGNAAGFLAITIIVFVLLGNILEGIPAILLFAPLLLPVSHAFGINDLHYAMVVVIAMSIGLFAPPFGIGFYAACAIGKVAPDEVIGHMWRYLGALIVGLIAVAAVPWFSTAFIH
ncbi:TRAP transporter large permease subunit [Ramlibacter sp. G-1-2-2]|uniref:TRAP transporter large permease subunit n=1 Tax=Ramlibacter agri TaxID=2728837 RepID=A0A848H5H3_9BURK|nr:TRAP transporter large permease subunit [Ramlibacter agri]NML44769.1 TRAP transporter large permease subunit [Ramlibacter agri]